MWYRVIIFVVVSLGERVEIDFGEGIWLAMGCGAVWIDDGGWGAALFITTATAGSEKAGWADAGAASSTEAVPDAVATTTTTADGQYRLRW